MINGVGQCLRIHAWRSQNAENVTHIKGRPLDQAMVLLIASLFTLGTALKGKNLPTLGTQVLFGSDCFMEANNMNPGQTAPKVAEKSADYS